MSISTRPTPTAWRRAKLKASDDMRAPLAFLLGKLDFAKEFRDFEVKPEGANYIVTAKAKTDKLPYEKVEMLVTPDYQIQRLVINGQDLSILTFQFALEKAESAGGRRAVQVPDARREPRWSLAKGSQ